MPDIAIFALPLALRRTKWAWLLVFLLLLAPSGLLHASGTPRAQKHEYRHEIFRLEEQWREAVLSANADEIAALLSDDYMAITATGTLQSKEQALADLRSGRVHLKAIQFSDRKVRYYGTTALVTSRAEVTGSDAEGEMTGSYRYTRVYVRNQQGIWKIVSFEFSRIRDAGERK